jgi:sensor domain CHASE-containing protein
MTLRRKTPLIIALTVMALIPGLYEVSSSILLTDFSRLARCDVARDVKWSKSAIGHELADVNDRAEKRAARADTDHRKGPSHPNSGTESANTTRCPGVGAC